MYCNARCYLTSPNACYFQISENFRLHCGDFVLKQNQIKNPVHMQALNFNSKNYNENKIKILQ